MDERRLSEALVGFARALAADFSIQKTLDYFAECVVEVLPVTGAGILLMDSDLDHHFVAATDAVILRIEDLQMDLGEGPCLLAYHSGQKVLVPDLSIDRQFRSFSARAVEAGLGAVFSFPLRFEGERLGALELYSEQPVELSQGDLDGAQTLADVMAGYLHNARHRSIVDRAVTTLQAQVLLDPLTGLPNRTLLFDRMHQAVRDGHRDPSTFVGVLFLDVDNLKATNDRFGHDAGDELLRGIVARLVQHLRPGDTLGRLAGDEFVIVCGGLASQRQAEVVAARVHQSLGEPIDIGDASVPTTVSIGIGFAGDGYGTPEQALADADALMYEAKRQGGGRTGTPYHHAPARFAGDHARRDSPPLELVSSLGGTGRVGRRLEKRHTLQLAPTPYAATAPSEDDLEVVVTSSRERGNMPADREVTATLIELADTLVTGYDLLDYLERLLQRSTEVMEADAGGVMLSDPTQRDGRLQLLTSTDDDTRLLELFELQRQEGPCVDCHHRGEPVIEHDLRRSPLWPQFTPMALEHGYRAVYALPLRLRGTTIGALNLFLVEPGAAAQAHVQAAQAFADMATIGIMQQRAVNEARELAAQLRIALHSRVVIEQAKGILAERLACELDEAYQLIRWHGRVTNRRLREVAAAVVAGTLDAQDLRPPPGDGG